MTYTNLTPSGETITETRDSATTPAIAKSAKVSSLAVKDSEALLGVDGVAVRPALEDEGALLWELARDAGGVDLNSPYAYMMTCRNFAGTCVVGEIYGKPAGFVTAHRVQGRPDTVFVWQVAVLPDCRGFGIAKRMLDALMELPACAGARKLEATVTSSNTASEKLFRSFAKARGAELVVGAGFLEDDFPAQDRHEAERLFTIQPVHPID